jgi:hypothetical protein
MNHETKLRLQNYAVVIPTDSYIKLKNYKINTVA